MSDVAPNGIEIYPVDGIPELRPGADLAGLIATAAPWLADDDIVVVTSKAVSKVEGRLLSVPTDPSGREQARQAAIEQETVRVVATRGPTRIVETRNGWVMAAAGVDASNLLAGELALLPFDSDDSARRLRAELAARLGVSVAVVVSDTFGRPWRRGQTDVAIGVAGIPAVTDLRGTLDTHGVPMQVTEIALADELAGAADLVKGKLAGRPVAVIRGLQLPPGDDAGAVALQRPLTEDMFHLGTRDVLPSRGSPERFGSDPVPLTLVRSAVEVAVRSAARTFGLDPTDLPRTSVLTYAGNESPPAEGDQESQLRSTATVVVEITALPTVAGEPGPLAAGALIHGVLVQLHAEGLAGVFVPSEDGHPLLGQVLIGSLQNPR